MSTLLHVLKARAHSCFHRDACARQKLLHEHADDPNYKGIIFVEQVALTFPLMELLNKSLGPALCVGCVSGGGSMTEPTRTKTLDQFRRSELRVLVCTNALEEGIDVPECAFVIRE